MKFILEEKDESYIKRVNEDLAEGKCPPLAVNSTDANYYLVFKCADVAKANNFILELLAMKQSESNEIEDKLGINVLQLRYDGNNAIAGELKEYLKDLLNRLENM